MNLESTQKFISPPLTCLTHDDIRCQMIAKIRINHFWSFFYRNKIFHIHSNYHQHKISNVNTLLRNPKKSFNIMRREKKTGKNKEKNRANHILSFSAKLFLIRKYGQWSIDLWFRFCSGLRHFKVLKTYYTRWLSGSKITFISKKDGEDLNVKYLKHFIVATGKRCDKAAEFDEEQSYPEINHFHRWKN